MSATPQPANELRIPLDSRRSYSTELSFVHPATPAKLLVKRGFDLVGAAALLIVCAPLMLLVALAIKLTSRGPVLYRSARAGKHGEPFQCLKFRTMVDGAHSMKAELSHLNEREEILFKIEDDPRITPVGRCLRKYSLDELPQLWNVVAGDMSLVGPRPPIVEEYELYSPHHRQRLAVTPGLTGLWQVEARRDPSFQTYVHYDLEYIRRWSLTLDFQILLRTVPAVLKGTGS